MSGRQELAILTISRFELVPSWLQTPIANAEKLPACQPSKNSACHTLFLLIYNESFN
jgi:hypothetical protein